MDPPSRVQSFYHSAMMPIPWLCTLTEEEEEEETTYAVPSGPGPSIVVSDQR